MASTRTRLLILIAIPMLLSTSRAEEAYEEDPPVASGALALPPARTVESMAGPRNWDFARLKRTLVESRASTVAELIAAVDRADETFFDRWTAFHDSRSRQKSTDKDPRVIALSNDGGLMLTFNGDPTKKGYAVVEVMEFDPAKGYEFREIHFPKEGAERGFTENEIESSLGFATVSKANPNECSLCHGLERPRPIWDAYFLWPGAYGKTDDQWDPTEKARLEANKSYWAAHERYGKVLTRYGPRKTYDIDPSYGYGERGFPSPGDFRRNLMMSRILSLQLSTLLVNEAKSRPGLVEALGNCRGSAPYDGEIYQDSVARMRRLEEEYARDPVLRTVPPGRLPFNPAAGEPTRVQTVLASYGLDATFFQPLQRQGQNFEDGGSGFRYLDTVIRSGADGRLVGDRSTCADFWKGAATRYKARKDAGLTLQ